MTNSVACAHHQSLIRNCSSPLIFFTLQATPGYYSPQLVRSFSLPWNCPDNQTVNFLLTLTRVSFDAAQSKHLFVHFERKFSRKDFFRFHVQPKEYETVRGLFDRACAKQAFRQCNIECLFQPPLEWRNIVRKMVNSMFANLGEAKESL